MIRLQCATARMFGASRMSALAPSMRLDAGDERAVVDPPRATTGAAVTRGGGPRFEPLPIADATGATGRASP